MNSTRRHIRGLSLIEVLMAVAVLGIAMPPVVSLYREVAEQSVDDTQQGVAVAVAEALLEEITSKTFRDPETKKSFGPEEDSRADYDDVDDYDGLLESPSQLMDGTSPALYTSLTTIVEVHHVTSADPDPVTPEPDGSTKLLRIRVSVSWTSGRGGKVVLTTLRSQHEVEDPLDIVDEAEAKGSVTKASGLSFQLSLENWTELKLQIEGFELSSESRGLWNLIQLDLGAEMIWSGTSAVPTGVLSLASREDARTIDAEGTRTLRAYFDAPPAGAHDFTLVLFFSDGSSEHVDLTVSW